MTGQQGASLPWFPGSLADEGEEVLSAQESQRRFQQVLRAPWAVYWVPFPTLSSLLGQNHYL